MTAGRVLVAIPCKDEVATVADVIARVPLSLASEGTAPSRGSRGVAVDVLVIDDGSTDGTAAAAAAAGATVIRHSRNRGLGESFRTAAAAALDGRYDALVTIDGDGQFAPEEIEQLAAPVLAGVADAATGSRFVPGATVDGMPAAKRAGNKLVSLIVSALTGRRFFDVSCGFRCYSREALLRMNLHGTFTNTHETFLSLAANHLTVVEVPVTVNYFPDRVSRVASSLTRYAARTLSIMVRWYRDYRPLRFFWGLAALFGVLGLSGAGVLAWHYARTGTFTGFIFAGMLGGFFLLVALLMFLGGLLADMLQRQRVTQERILYLLRDQRDATTGRP
jgi:glycosyltransferase involved in cell wall biosynthesis